MLKIITAVLTVLTLLLMLVTGFTLWGTLAFLLAAAAGAVNLRQYRNR